MKERRLKSTMLRKTTLILAVIGISIVPNQLWCQENRLQMKKEIENGVEIIINNLEPYKIKGKPSTFTLEKRLTIDQERQDLIEKGMMYMGEFDVDHDGNIYILGYRNEGNLIFKLDRTGKFVTSFAKRGQGPGELELPLRPLVTEDYVVVTDRAKKMVFYDRDGKLIKEEYFRQRVAQADLLENGKYLFYGWLSGYKTHDYAWESLSIYDSEFQKIRDLDVYKSDYRDTRYPPFFMWRVTNGHIYVINEERGYEILVYDLDGNIVRKIRKKYIPVSPDEEIKKLIMGPHYVETSKGSSYVPDPLPPIKFFIADDEGRLFIMTYEEGHHSGEYLYDIFNPEGLFIGRKSLNLPWAGKYFGPKFEMIKENHLYCYRDKENGFSELVVYRMHWQ